VTRFFDTYRRFYQTTGTPLEPNRFQQRWRVIIEENKGLFQGARVLDIASHDGRWSFAALKAGAAYVEGVEARAELVRRALANFTHYGIARSQYNFVCQDAVKYLANARLAEFDVVLNLGFFYHTLKHLEILENMARTKAKSFIIDTAVNMSNDAVITIVLEDVNSLLAAIDHLNSDTSTVPSGRISRLALKWMLDYVGYDCAEMDWHRLVNDFVECEEYEKRMRSTFIATRVRADVDRAQPTTSFRMSRWWGLLRRADDRGRVCREGLRAETRVDPG
jgi:hypothetical protein